MTTRIRRWAIAAGVVLLGLAAGGFLFAAAGLAPVKASAGHWAVTRAMLQFAKNRAVATQSIGIEAPDLTQPWWIVKGAGHYESGCRPCHGGPELQNPKVAGAMLPTPPYLPRRIERRDPAELFFIVKHGLKFTGMPAWPAPGRDDEVWAVVAFLLELPQLDVAGYERLVHGETSPAPAGPLRRDSDGATAIAALVESDCVRCHGAEGVDRASAAFPRLAGQKRQYLLNALNAYGNNARPSGLMGPVAAALTPDERAAVADYYSELPPMATAPMAGAPAPDNETTDLGEAIAREGIPHKGVPSCMDCHGPGDHRRSPAYPDLAGQYAEYIELQLALFADGRRGGSPYAHIMHHVASRLDSLEARAVAAWYASLGARRGGGGR